MMALNSKMIRLIGWLTFILGTIAICGLVYDYILYYHLNLSMATIKPLGLLDQLSKFVWISYLYFLAFHGIAFLFLLQHFRFYRRFKPLNIALLVIGVLSFIAVFGNWGILGDISKEYKMGWDVSGEWTILWLFLLLHTLFVITISGLSFYTIRTAGSVDPVPESPGTEETVFTLAQYTGIICGILVFAWCLMILYFSRTFRIPQYHLVMTPLLVMIPYFLVSGYWLLLRLRNRISDWYDEKQWLDISKAGVVTLILSVPAMAFLFFLLNFRENTPVTNLIWFPYFLSVILFLFSASTLYFYKRV